MNDKEAAHAKPQRKARLFVLEEKRGSCFAAWREAVFAVASKNERQTGGSRKAAKIGKALCH
jgi:hypothetical protein